MKHSPKWTRNQGKQIISPALLREREVHHRVYAAQALIQQSLDSVAQNVHLLVGMNVILCTVLIILVLFYNYQPLARLVKKSAAETPGAVLPNWIPFCILTRPWRMKKANSTWNCMRKT